MFVKSRLLTPGPTAIAESTRLAIAAAAPHHRSSEFGKTFLRASELLRWFWDTDDDVLFVTGSGTAGMEAAMRTCLRAGDEVVVVTGGKFAERWDTIARHLGCNVVTVTVEWGDGADVAAVEAAARGCADLRAVIMVASETSTGVLHDVRACAERVRAVREDALMMVDGITAVGSVDLSMKRDGLDVLVSGTQKAFGLPPGGAMVGMSARAWQAADRPECSAFYLDLRKEKKQSASGQSAFTPGQPFITGIVDVFERWHEAGRLRVIEHTQTLASATRAAAEALGLALFPKGEPSPALTAIEMPEGVSAKTISTWMRVRCGVSVAAGQDHLKERVIRIGHLGAVDAIDTIGGIAALEMALSANGVEVKTGAGVAAAQKVISQALLTQEPISYSP